MSQTLQQFFQQYGLIIWIVVLFAIFYFLFIRPQRSKQKKHQDMLGGLKPGDEVVTIGGIKGRIRSISENTISITVYKDVSIEFLKSAISTKTNIKN
jgi:preprotein translocase subunit YajC